PLPLPPHPTRLPYTTLFRSTELVFPRSPPCMSITLPFARPAPSLSAILSASQILPRDCLVPVKPLQILSHISQTDSPSHQAQSIDRKSTRLNSSHVSISYAV